MAIKTITAELIATVRTSFSNNQPMVVENFADLITANASISSSCSFVCDNIRVRISPVSVNMVASTVNLVNYKAGPSPELASTALLDIVIPTTISIDFSKLNIPFIDGEDYVFELTEGFFKDVGGNQSPSKAIANLLSFRRSEQGISTQPVVFTASTLVTRIKQLAANINDAMDFTALASFSPASAFSFTNVSASMAMIGNAIFTLKPTTIDSEVTMNIPYGRLRFGVSSMVEDSSVMTIGNFRAKLFEIAMDGAFLNASLGDRIRFGVTSMPASTTVSADTFSSYTKSVTCNMTAQSSMTSEISLQITLSRTITNPVQDINSAFASAIDISGNYIVAGDVGYPTSDTGTAYIFNASIGSTVYTLANPNPSNSLNPDDYGVSVAIDGNYAVVGAQYEDGAGGSFQGKAYLWDITTGTVSQTQTNPNSSTDYYFGRSVDIDGTRWAVGQDRDGVRVYPVGSGTSYTITMPNSLDRLFNVAISGNRLIVAVRRFDDDFNLNTIFKLYQYTLNASSVTLERTIDNPNPVGSTLSDSFGSDIAVYGDYAIVGTPGEGINDEGRAYIYDLTTGNLEYTFSRPAGTTSNSPSTISFGNKVAMNDKYAVIADNDYVHLFNYLDGYHETSYSVPNCQDVAIEGNTFIVSGDNAPGKFIRVYNF